MNLRCGSPLQVLRLCQLPQKSPNLFERTLLGVHFVIEAMALPFLLHPKAHADEIRGELLLHSFEHRSAGTGNEHRTFSRFARVAHALAGDNGIEGRLEVVRCRLFGIVDVLECEVLPVRMISEEALSEEAACGVRCSGEEEKHVQYD